MKVDEQKKKAITDLIYKNLNYIYCDNCRFNYEISRDESNEKLGYYPCEDCYRKSMGWEISMSESEDLTKRILKILNEE